MSSIWQFYMFFGLRYYTIELYHTVTEIYALFSQSIKDYFTDIGMCNHWHIVSVKLIGFWNEIVFIHSKFSDCSKLIQISFIRVWFSVYSLEYANITSSLQDIITDGSDGKVALF